MILWQESSTNAACSSRSLHIHHSYREHMHKDEHAAARKHLYIKAMRTSLRYKCLGVFGMIYLKFLKTIHALTY